MRGEMEMADGTGFSSRSQPCADAGPYPRSPRLYACCGCGDRLRLNDLNDAMMCLHCEPIGDEEDAIDVCPAAMLREHGTWGL